MAGVSHPATCLQYHLTPLQTECPANASEMWSLEPSVIYNNVLHLIQGVQIPTYSCREQLCSTNTYAWINWVVTA